LFIYDRDIRIEDSPLWLDARRKRELSFVSHAHADHATKHEAILATPATLALAAERRRLRRLKMKRPPKREPQEIPLEYRKPFAVDGATVTLLPAGHILGSAQILVEQDGRRLLYSGDFCADSTSAAEDLEIRHADVLIMECTYGLPEHRFPPRAEAVKSLTAFIERTFARSATPVLLCYALGKGQEVLRLVTAQGYRAALEEETWRLARVYESFGVEFGRYRRIRSPVRRDEVVVTPNLKAVGDCLAGRDIRTCAVTGWAVGGFSYRARYADERVPLSDHADFRGLIEFARAVKPEIVYILHGPSEFGFYLRKAGLRVGDLRERQARRVL
jgi:putative mRNA 3-end processing factor